MCSVRQATESTVSVARKYTGSIVEQGCSHTNHTSLFGELRAYLSEQVILFRLLYALNFGLCVIPCFCASYGIQYDSMAPTCFGFRTLNLLRFRFATLLTLFSVLLCTFSMPHLSNNISSVINSESRHSHAVCGLTYICG